ncbi:MAG: SIS domain-containing protein [Armatimonadetes bacterium]|nr:SIS domain-containing protein [Armatimonadota bacterium]
MLQEIHQQPEAVRRTLEENAGRVRDLCAEVARRDVRLVTIAGRGTSDNAAVLGRYLFEIITGIPVSLSAGSVLTMYGAWPRVDSALAIGISQSGQAQEVVEAIQRSREMGALTLGITNDPDSELARAAEHVFLLHAGPERSVAATKTYTCTLAALYSLVAGLPAVHPLGEGLVEKLTAMPDQMGDMLEMAPEIARGMERYRYMDECVVVARGLNLATAFETALKMSETGYIVARGYSAADLMHGPIASVEPGSACFLVAPPGAVLPGLRETARALGERQAEQVTLSSDPELLALATTPLRVPFAVEEVVSPLVYIVAGQLIAHSLALLRHHDPDHPRGLQKVTRTR